MTKKLALKILEKIKQHYIKPKPKWHFWIKEIILWFLFGVSIVIGSLAFTLIIHLLKNDILPMRKFLHANEYFLYFPFFWLLILVVFIALAYYHWQKTEKGYKYKPLIILGVSILTSLLISCILLNLNLGRPLTKQANQLPGYSKLGKMRGQHWLKQNPNRLAGQVLSEIENNQFLLLDASEIEWTILTDENTYPEDLSFILPNEKLRLFGEKETDDTFQAIKILPWDFPINKKLNAGLKKMK
ncbi:hypothetical protein HN858_04670 [Candidatus Falkowbacteria bacterium]|jgi:hypothetical protein|nr:hypothetical protein [Candidatus Falkowbacteria bacterium]MBT5502606.1 hypothetical protein [Candidatus Falkowbacteria bacterium]MBT6574585.1 hypothetical protein [Candidatus Falkowbacteria bacterium]MBT7348935.1 hypothetical protein [Candidatus Falkowbacteria bacterium]MBT7500338.1 hypothetical protein [Candidatus Falkowbacteria bacterium]